MKTLRYLRSSLIIEPDRVLVPVEPQPRWEEEGGIGEFKHITKDADPTFYKEALRLGEGDISRVMSYNPLSKGDLRVSWQECFIYSRFYVCPFKIGDEILAIEEWVEKQSGDILARLADYEDTQYLNWQPPETMPSTIGQRFPVDEPPGIERGAIDDGLYYPVAGLHPTNAPKKWYWTIPREVE